MDGIRKANLNDEEMSFVSGAPRMHFKAQEMTADRVGEPRQVLAGTGE
jgi:hypothetical protein